MDLQTCLKRPIPFQADAKAAKQEYRKYPLLASARSSEPLVDIREYGLAGQSYYSRANAATGKPVPGVDDVIMLRLGIVRKLADMNYALETSSVATAVFGQPVELFVNEGFRSTELQKELYETVFPRLIRAQLPDLSELEALARRDELIAAPSNSASPAPHATGAAFDIRLRYKQADLGFVPKSFVPMAARSVDMSDAATPDYFEHKAKLTRNDELLQRNRRAFYWIMRGALLGDDSGFVCNPTEWWHWSHGDQLWGSLTQAPFAFYSEAKQ